MPPAPPAAPDTADPESDAIEENRERRALLGQKNEHGARGWLAGLKETAALSAPVVLGNCAKSLTNLYVMLRFPSQRTLGTQSLASAVLANFYIQVFGNATAIGSASALETLCSQAFGAGRVELLGLYLQRGILFYAVFLYLPVVALFWNAESVFLALGQSPVLARGAAQICRGAIWGMVPNGIIECFQHYLLSQGQVWAPVVIYWVGFGVALWTGNMWITGKVTTAEGAVSDVYDLTSVGWTISAVCTSYAVMAVIYSLLFTSKSSFPGFQPLRALAPSELWGYVKLAISGYLMLVADLIVFEGLSVLSGLISESALASQGILLSITSLIYFTVPVCIGFIAAVRVGRALGSNHPAGAKSAFLSSLLLGLLLASVISTLLVALRTQLPLFFSSDPAVINPVTTLLPLVALISWIDNAAISTTGVLRGLGKQHLSAFSNILGLVVLGLGSACVMVLRFGWGLWGIWGGLLAGTIAVAGGQTIYLTVIVDWKKEAKRVSEKFEEKKVEETARVGGSLDDGVVDEGDL